FLSQLARPAHLLRNLLLGFIGVAVLFLQFHVFVRAGVGLFQEFFIIVLIPFFLRVFLPMLMLLDGGGEPVHEIGHARGSLFGAFDVLLWSHPPLWRGN